MHNFVFEDKKFGEIYEKFFLFRNGISSMSNFLLF